MKNIKQNIAVALIAGIFTFSAFAVDIVPSSESRAKMIPPKAKVSAVKQDKVVSYPLKEYFGEEVEIAELPQALKSAVISKFVAFSIEKAFMNEGNTYCLTLKNGTSRRIAYYKEDGEYLKQEAVKEIQLVALD